jgi:hypothetical protein
MVEVAEYCRQIESYLCRKNAGHLIRIVGPAFEQVSGWAEQGVPLNIAFKGIDRCCERYHAKGLRRRPMRIEFCEADILELFDDWRRAVGVTPSAGTGAEPQRKQGLASHIERVVARLALPRGENRGPRFDQRATAAMHELDGLLVEARPARGRRRAAIIERLADLDRELLECLIGELDQASAASYRREAERELAPFAGRMAAGTREAAEDAAFRRLVREGAGLPAISFE